MYGMSEGKNLKEQRFGKAVSGNGKDENVFYDTVDLITAGPESEDIFHTCRRLLKAGNPELYCCLTENDSLDATRERVFACLERKERLVRRDDGLYALERSLALDCIRMLRNIWAPINERRCDVSALDYLWRFIAGRMTVPDKEIMPGFLIEFVNLFRGVDGCSNIYDTVAREGSGVPAFLQMQGREAAQSRSQSLDEICDEMDGFLSRYPSGLSRSLIDRRRENKARILDYFGGTDEDWQNHVWQTRHVIRHSLPLYDLINISEEQGRAIDRALKNRIPFGITPYYLSLMDRDPDIGLDHAVRAQVLPPPDYVDLMTAHRANRDSACDFMGEHDTSPIDLVTRRYPGIAILKPFNTCAQICVYCQRNWEIDEVLDPEAMATRDRIDRAVAWFREHPGVGEILITGGDPCVMPTRGLQKILEKIAPLNHIYRIRIGTRTPVVLPMRWTDELVDMIASFHEPGRREIAIVSHFEHSYEISPEAMAAVRKIRKAGMSVYNQQVFTMENSRRFETAKLRLDLKRIGVDPYYTFNMKGKEETRRFMVPTARILQERKEEARLLPGLDRTDEPVFNVPKLGKNHLQAGQDHWLLMIKPDGSRVYEFHPWEKNLKVLPPYNYSDIPIYDYLKGLAERGEDLKDYRTIWYYF